MRKFPFFSHLLYLSVICGLNCGVAPAFDELVIANLKNGENTLCLRGEWNPLTPFDTCEVFSCSPLVIDGVTYDVMLFNDSPNPFGKPILTLSSPDQLGPPTELMTVTSIMTNEILFADLNVVLELPAKSDLNQRLSEFLTSTKYRDTASSLTPFLDKYFNLINRRNNALGFCWNHPLSDLHEREAKLVRQAEKQMSQIPVAQKIFFEDGILVSELHEIPEYQLRAREALPASIFHFDPQVEIHFNHLNTRMSDLPTAIASVSEARALELFKSVKSLEGLPRGYINDGCFARAHVIAEWLQQQGVHVKKVWLAGPLAPKSAPDVNWGYHVAPIITVSLPDRGDESWAIDPEMNSSAPLRVQEWIASMHVGVPGEIVQARLPFPRNAALFGRPVLAISPASYLFPHPQFIDRSVSLLVAEAYNKIFRLPEQQVQAEQTIWTSLEFYD